MREGCGHGYQQGPSQGYSAVSNSSGGQSSAKPGRFQMQPLPENFYSTASTFQGASSMQPGASHTMNDSTATITTMFTEGIPTMVPPSKDADGSTIIDFVNNQLDRIGTELEVLDGLRLLGGGLSQRMQGGTTLEHTAECIRFLSASSADPKVSYTTSRKEHCTAVWRIVTCCQSGVVCRCDSCCVFLLWMKQ